LYRDDGLAVFKKMNARSGGKARKVFCEILGDLGKITVQRNLKVVSYLDVTLNLTTGKYELSNLSIQIIDKVNDRDALIAKEGHWAYRLRSTGT